MVFPVLSTDLRNSRSNRHRQSEQNEEVHQLKNKTVVAVELQKSIIFQYVQESVACNDVLIKENRANDSFMYAERTTCSL
jgi:hypothetical protein